MRIKRRRLLLTSSLVISSLLLFFLSAVSLLRRGPWPLGSSSSSSYPWKGSHASIYHGFHSMRDYPEHPSIPVSPSECRMETCFNFTRCRDELKVYVYPEKPSSSSSLSPPYLKILNVLRNSPYYTSDPEAACLFVLSMDTLDRDPLSTSYFVRNMPARFASLPHWNGGLNHVIFNLYSGTYPDYAEDLNFDAGKAILAKASIANLNYRPGFDVSLPLFHKFHPEKGGEEGTLKSHHFPIDKKHFLAFKGKRYVYGIGSETRNSLHHLHNGQELVLVTTCRHGKNWKELKDDRCDEDNREFDRWDYDSLLLNSTFCLVPRGRRLGSFRFLETLQAGCVPVVLSNDWILPFSEIIDWSTAAVIADERLLLQVPEMLHSISQERIFSMRKQTQKYWNQYLKSVENIVTTTLEIIHSRISLHGASRESHVWNSSPGGLVTLPSFSDVLDHFPFFGPSLAIKEFIKFTAVIFVPNPSIMTHIYSNRSLFRVQPLYKLVKSISASSYAAKICILWMSANSSSPIPSFPPIRSRRRIPIHHLKIRDLNERFSPLDLIDTDAILSLDDDSLLTTEEIDFAFGVWKNFPDRIVGYPGRSHYWDSFKQSWVYTSKWLNELSMVLTGSAIYHRYYHTLYHKASPPGTKEMVARLNNCEDILMNFLVSSVTRKSPIKVTQRKQYKHLPSNHSMSGERNESFYQKQDCINFFVSKFGTMPLRKTYGRFDPLLFKDQVSSSRKKYKQIDMIPIESSARSP